MATTTENSLRIDNIVNNAVYVSALSNTEKREVLDALVSQGVMLNYTDPIVKAGDRVFGKDLTNTLFGGDSFIAKVVNVPVGAWSASNFEDVFRY